VFCSKAPSQRIVIQVSRLPEEPRKTADCSSLFKKTGLFPQKGNATATGGHEVFDDNTPSQASVH